MFTPSRAYSELSWVHLHLTSIHCVPISQLSEFAIHRTVPPLATLPYPPALQSLKIPSVHDLCKPQVVPTELLKALVAKGATLSALSLDWWQTDATEVEQLARACVNLEKLQLLVGCPLHKIVRIGIVPRNTDEPSADWHDNTLLKYEQTRQALPDDTAGACIICCCRS